MATKKELRREIRLQKSCRTEGQLAEESEMIMQKLLRHPKVKAAQCVLLYYSLPDEVYTHKAVKQLHDEGKTVLLPKVTDEENMEVVRFEGTEKLTEGSFHIHEPVGTPFADIHSIEVAVVPGMSFDTHGNRLGRGKGYYDRFLAQLTDVYKIGVCFDFQKRDNIPADEHDIRMNEII